MDESVIIVLASILILGAILFAVIAFTKPGSKHLNKQYYQAEWLKIENKLSREQEATHQLCILDADKLVDHALKHSGYKGQTMGDRLKNAKNILSDRNSIWSAHKLRNKIAHESGARATYDDARHALSGFKKALKDLGAI